MPFPGARGITGPSLIETIQKHIATRAHNTFQHAYVITLMFIKFSSD
jgi:hypothetical protein